MKTDAPKKCRWANAVVIGLFFGVLWLPTIDFFTGVDVTRPQDENRLPAPLPRLPHWNFSGAKTFMAGAENYFNDHFGFRKRLIRWSQQWKSRLFRDESGHKVVIGKAGWLYTGELQMVEHYMGIAKFSPAQLQAWQKLLESRRDWLAARGIKFLFIVAPDKQDIYPEFLPDWLLGATAPSRETKLDQFLNYMKEHSTVEVVDMRPVLLAAKNLAPLYLVNDLHWNAFGGFIGGQEVIRALQRQLPGLPPLRLGDFTWTNQPSAGGDMAQYLGREPVENNYFVFHAKPEMPAPRVIEQTPIDTIWDRHIFCTVTENESVPDNRAVIFHDSFGLPWKPYFAQCFRRIFFMQERRIFSARIIEENHPNIVINEMLERYFNTLVPEELMAKDALP